MPKQLRDYQRASIDALYDFWGRSSGNPLIIAPCGAGKSLIASHFIMEAVQGWPGTRVLLLTHRKELLTQDADELLEEWPDAPVGYWSASLKRKDRNAQILFAGIQSFSRVAHTFDPFELVIIDEAHLVPRDTATQYGKTLDLLRLMNPRVKVVGLTATPYRLDSGRLDQGDGAWFDGIAHEIAVSELIKRGDLCEVVGKRGAEVADLTGVRKRAGEFVAKEAEAAFEADGLVEKACAEIVRFGQDRRAWLVFASGIDHGEHITETLRGLGVAVEFVHGGTPLEERDRITRRFRDGALRCLVNVDVLTIGFNAPVCDMGVLLRATESTALYVQIVGRLMRNYPGKADALLLDYGGNVERHGPIDAVAPKRQGGDGTGEAPAKACPECMSIVHLSAMECPDCGYLWPEREAAHEATAYGGAVMSHQVRAEWLDVAGVQYARHAKAGKPDSVRVTYRVGLRTVSHWWCPEHGGYARAKSEQQWRAMGRELPETTDEALAACADLPAPASILVRPEGKYERVIRWAYTQENAA